MTARMPAAFAAGAILLLPAAAPAASRYSLRGAGEPVLPTDAEARGLGGAEAASRVPGLAGNPASLALAERTLFYGTWITEWIRTEEPRDGGSAVRQDYDGFVPNLGLIFPLPGRLRFGTGLLVERRQGGDIEFAAETPDGIAYRQSFSATGNLLRIPALLALDVKRAQIGAGIDVALLNSTVHWRNEFDTPGFADSDDIDETALWAIIGRAGTRIPVGSRAAVGAWIAAPLGDASGNRRLENEADDGGEDSIEIDAEGELPLRFGVGLDATPWTAWRVAADWGRENWEETDLPQAIGTFQDVERLAFGIERASVSGGLRWPVRAGYRTEQLHTRDAGGREIREHAFALGSGFSFADGRGKFDWFVEYARRGKPDESEFYEQTVRLGLTLTGQEEWSGRRPPEDETEDW